MMINPLLMVDNYKLDHVFMYPKGMTYLYSNFTPRNSRMEGIEEVVVFGIQVFIKNYLIKAFNESFFYKKERKEYEDVLMNGDKGWNLKAPDFYKNKALNEYKKYVKLKSYKHIEDLWDLGYLPIEIKSLAEGTKCPIGVPLLTISNTHPDFAWLVNYLETILSTQLWQSVTSATIAYNYRKNIDFWSRKTTGSVVGNEWLGHDFSMRGMSSLETAWLSGLGHLTSFNGTDVVPAMVMMDEFYGTEGKFVFGGVPASEHSIEMFHYDYEKEEEDEYLLHLLNEYPTGILSIVCDGKDFWKFVTVTIPKYKDKILARDGKVVIRPDSGKPIDIICGIPKNERSKSGGACVVSETRYHNMCKGAIELLWDTFGGTVNDQGYKVLDSHIGLIYGDGIGLHNLDNINSRLADKGFATTNWVAGFGSYGYQYNTRDTFGFAMKATYGEITSIKPKFKGDNNVEVEGKEIFKDPITDNGSKKSAKGLLQVYKSEGAHGHSKLMLKQSCTKKEESQGLLKPVFRDSKLLIETSLEEIRERLGY